ncbi:MAG: hypothetical protein QM760_16670, partial [Nibricoccus sp.]
MLKRSIVVVAAIAASSYGQIATSSAHPKIAIAYPAPIPVVMEGMDALGAIRILSCFPINLSNT